MVQATIPAHNWLTMNVAGPTRLLIPAQVRLNHIDQNFFKPADKIETPRVKS